MSNSTVPATSDRLTATTPITLPSSATTTPQNTPTTSAIPSTTSSPTTTTTPPTTSSTPSTTSTHTASATRITVVHTSTYVPPSSSGSTTFVFQTTVSTPVASETHASSTTSSSASTSSTNSTLLGDGSNNSGNGSNGLSTAGKTAVAVVVPVVVVALLVIAGIFLFRKRKQKKEAEELRRKEIQDYGYNPNHDPTLPSVMQETGSEMAEDTSGYRGWGAAAAGSNRKASTTLSGGLTHAQMSDSGSNLNLYGGGPGSPGNRASDGNSGDGLMGRRETMGSDDLGALGVAPVTSNQVRRGPSNASSAYSGGARSDHSDEQPPLPGGPGYGYDYNTGTQYGYSQHGPYGDGSYGGGQDSGMPVVRDVSARRNTRIQQGGTYQQGNSGIAQNF